MASYTKTVQMFKRHFETTISMTGRNVAQTERGSVTRRRIAPLRTLFRLSLKRHNSFCPLVLQIKYPGITFPSHPPVFRTKPPQPAVAQTERGSAIRSKLSHSEPH